MALQLELTTRRKLSRIARRLPLATQWRLLRWALILLDATMLGLAFAAAFVLRFVLSITVTEPGLGGDVAFYSSVVAALIPSWLLIFLAIGLYNEHNLLGGTREYALVFDGVSAGMLLVVVGRFLKPDFIVARGWLLFAWLLAFLFVGGARFWMRRLVYWLRGRGYFLSPTVIVGANDEGVAVAVQLSQWRTSGLQILGFVTEEPVEERIVRNLYRLGGLDDLGRIVEDFEVGEIVVATSALTRPQLVELFRRFAHRRGVRLRLSGGLFEIMTTGLAIKELAYVPLLSVQPVRLTGADRALKAILDYSVAAAVVLIASPLLAALAVAVRLASPGPVFHRRRVLGRGGGTFHCFKFRTMRVDGEALLAARPELQAELAANHKLKDDPRVTRLGRALRRTSLDELPQMFNVLLGQMSVVGPRMISPAEHEKYGQWDMNLLTVKPGITGLWQVSGRSETTYEERVHLDMNYVRNWTIWLDLQILLRTVPAVLRGRGAY